MKILTYSPHKLSFPDGGWGLSDGKFRCSWCGVMWGACDGRRAELQELLCRLVADKFRFGDGCLDYQAYDTAVHSCTGTSHCVRKLTPVSRVCGISFTVGVIPTMNEVECVHTHPSNKPRLKGLVFHAVLCCVCSDCFLVVELIICYFALWNVSRLFWCE